MVPSNSIDYIFVDPPFGDNLIYSELSFIWDAWLKIVTNNEKEAIICRAQKKALSDYSCPALCRESLHKKQQILPSELLH